MNLTLFFETLAFAGVIALITIVIKEILYREPILHWFYRFGERYEGRWFFMPIWGCHKCMAGQLALWWYIALHFNSYSILGHLFAVCAAIQLSNIFKSIFSKWN